ncbi:MAG: amidohydrolase [Oscillospiraceae bacterium]|nr:amidohydrolase [Oscillospiraceae bacterium]
MNKQQIFDYIESKKDCIIHVNDRIWEYAETAFVEYRSVDLLCSVLEEEGFEVQKGIAKLPTAFSARFGCGKPVIGLLAEYDALDGLNQKGGLAVKEPTSEEDAGKPGHGCGHNCLGAGVVAAALGIKAYLESDPAHSGTVIVYGCPGEEGGSGKAFMAREGVFDECDVALTWHPGPSFAVTNGSSLANYQVHYKFYGIAAHAGSQPQNGRSALDAVELMNTGTQYLREHMIEKARIHYAITNTGGFSPNVVQSRADVLYLIRAPKSDYLAELYERVNNVARGACLMTDTRVEIDFVKACSEKIRNDVLAKLIYQNMEQLPLPTYTQEEQEFAAALREQCRKSKTPLQMAVDTCGEALRPQLEELFAEDTALSEFLLPYYANDIPVGGSTDVGDVSWVCPTGSMRGMTTVAGTPGHSWQFVACNNTSIAHKGTLYSGKVLAATAYDLLNDPALIEAAKAEHTRRVAPEGYKCPIPADVMPRAISDL